MEYKIAVDSKSYCKAILMIYNFKLRLSDLELDIVSVLLRSKLKMVNTNSREIIIKELNIDKYTLNNYIKRIKDKGIFSKVNKDLIVDPNLFEIIKHPKVSFEFIVNDNN